MPTTPSKNAYCCTSKVSSKHIVEQNVFCSLIMGVLLNADNLEKWLFIVHHTFTYSLGWRKEEIGKCTSCTCGFLSIAFILSESISCNHASRYDFLDIFFDWRWLNDHISGLTNRLIFLYLGCVFDSLFISFFWFNKTARIVMC